MAYSSLIVPSLAFTAIAVNMIYHIDKGPKLSNEQKVAKAIVKKKKDLKEFFSLRLVGSQATFLENSSSVSRDNIKRLVVPSLHYGDQEIIMLAKYQTAIVDYYKDHDPVIAPTCIELSSVPSPLISSEECNVVEGITYNFFEYNSGDIAFTTDRQVAEIVKKLDPTLEIVKEDENTTSFLDKYPVSRYSINEIKNKAHKKEVMQKQIEKLTEIDPTAASRINRRMAILDPTKAMINSRNIVSALNRNTVDTESLKEVAKDAYFIEEKLKTLDKQKFGVTTTTIDVVDPVTQTVQTVQETTDNIHIEQSIDVQTFIDAYLSQDDKDALSVDAVNSGLENTSNLIKLRRGI